MEYKLGYDSWGDEERSAIQRVLDSGRYSMGDETKAFEAEFAEYIGAKHAVMVNSGSSANLVIISALVQDGRLNPGDEVIVPMLSWATMYYPLWQHGLIQVFMDIDIQTLTLDVRKLSHERLLSEKTKAVFVPNILGNPADYNALISFCWENDLILIEDNCEGLGSEHFSAYDTKKVGNIGVAGSYSFFFSHHLQTMEGGMITTNDDGLADMMRSIRSHGWSRGTQWEDSSNPYDFIYLGYNVRPIEMSAAVGRVQLSRIGEFLTERTANANLFIGLMGGILGTSVQQVSVDCNSSWFGLAVRFETKEKRDLVRDALIASGVETRPIISGNFLNQTVMSGYALNDPRNLDYRIVCDKNIEHTNSSMIEDTGIMLGNDGFDMSDKIESACEIIGKTKLDV